MGFRDSLEGSLSYKRVSRIARYPGVTEDRAKKHRPSFRPGQVASVTVQGTKARRPRAAKPRGSAGDGQAGRLSALDAAVQAPQAGATGEILVVAEGVRQQDAVDAARRRAA